MSRDVPRTSTGRPGEADRISLPGSASVTESVAVSGFEKIPCALARSARDLYVERVALESTQSFDSSPADDCRGSSAEHVSRVQAVEVVRADMERISGRESRPYPEPHVRAPVGELAPPGVPEGQGSPGSHGGTRTLSTGMSSGPFRAVYARSAFATERWISGASAPSPRVVTLIVTFEEPPEASVPTPGELFARVHDRESRRETVPPRASPGILISGNLNGPAPNERPKGSENFRMLGISRSFQRLITALIGALIAVTTFPIAVLIPSTVPEITPASASIFSFTQS